MGLLDDILGLLKDILGEMRLLLYRIHAFFDRISLPLQVLSDRLLHNQIMYRVYCTCHG